jgi:16S rRNA (guanine966-N2)-methyltransferase
VLSVVDVPGLRPTPDRVRETVFNWLTHALDAWSDRAVLDLFAGTGALGFEASSRGASPVVLVESHARAVEQLVETKSRLHADDVEIRRGEAIATAAALATGGRRFDVIFLDPPFGSGLLERVLPLCDRLCAAEGFVYVEAPHRLPADGSALAGFETYREDRAGEVFYHLLHRKKTA